GTGPAGGLHPDVAIEGGGRPEQRRRHRLRADAAAASQRCEGVPQLAALKGRADGLAAGYQYPVAAHGRSKDGLEDVPTPGVDYVASSVENFSKLMDTDVKPLITKALDEAPKGS